MLAVFVSTLNEHKTLPYIGRFAPSPSGALHFGSLVAAVGSYLQAKSNNGLWKVRIEDIDPPREIKGATQDILLTLLAYGLQWDGDVLYQSQQYFHYEAFLNQLSKNNLSYYCQCTRKTIKQQGGLYQGNCRDKKNAQENSALRLNLKNCHLTQFGEPINHFVDQLHGKITTPQNDDFILKRKDGFYAYNLAVVIDDINQNITEIVRGADLIETTTKQLVLYRLLNKPAPTYLHLPLAVMSAGNKLSKQNHALPVDKVNPPATLLKVLIFLGLSPPTFLSNESCPVILDWAIIHWDLKHVSRQYEIQI